MMIDWLATALPLADTEVGFFGSLLAQIWLWARVAIGIGLVIFVHELGHFLAAKTFGVKCEKFYVGFDVPIRIGPIKFPRTLGKFTYGETEYGIGILPLGGYVKMLGQDDDPRKAKEEADRVRISDGDDEEDAIEQLDPRSFPAKKVWQRMIIISAGVIVNVITGVLFAAVAYGFGVSYTPAVVGGVTPGGPAWEAGIEPGGRVVAIGEYKSDEMHFREMRKEIVTAGLKNPDKPVKVSIRYDDEVRTYDLVTAPHPMDNDLRMIGIQMSVAPELGKKAPAAAFGVAGDVLKEADGGSRIVSFDGTAVDGDSLAPGTRLFDYLNSNPHKTVSLEMKRSDGSSHTVKLPPQKSKSVGLQFAAGPILSVSKNGPAKEAGVKVGDEIIAVGDNESVDAFGLPIDLAMAGETVTLKLRRKDGDDEQVLTVELKKSDFPQTVNPYSGATGEIASNAFGFSYQPKATLVGDMPSSADGESLQAGDVVKEVHVVIDDAISASAGLKDQEGVLETLEDLKLDTAISLTNFNEALQVLPVGTKVVVLAERPPKNKVIKTTLTVSESDRVTFERGVVFVTAEQIETARSFPHALSLGVREGKRRFGDVVEFLGMLVRGKIKAKLVGGPIKIAQIAANEAERGVPALLLFLTMLSMNLAILNFLPIPALDGGHMVFLIAEAIRGKRVNEELEMRLTLAGVIALLALMGFVFFNDIFGI